jgi:hypothetical protein
VSTLLANQFGRVKVQWGFRVIVTGSMSSSRSCQSSSNAMTYTHLVIASILTHSPLPTLLPSETSLQRLYPLCFVLACESLHELLSLPSRPTPRPVPFVLFRFIGTALRMRYTRPCVHCDFLLPINHTGSSLILRGCRLLRISHIRLPLTVNSQSCIAMISARSVVGLTGGSY